MTIGARLVMTGISYLHRLDRDASKVIVTTRSIRVSTIVGSTESYNLKILTDDECWKLMRNRILVKNEKREIFEVLGNEIAKKCNGLPLAAKAIGSILHLESEKNGWYSILKSELWDLPQDCNGIFPSLMLSYLHLPAHLRRCFAYCSIFPRNHKFKVDELVLLWMAEGFIQPTGEQKLEDIGKDYFVNLSLRSFFQLSSSRISYTMHDLIHDLARLVSSDTCVQVKHDTSQHYPLFGNAYHLSLHLKNGSNFVLKATMKNERLRTFLVICEKTCSVIIDPNIYSNLKFMRVLDLSNSGLLELDESIENLIYLRYLDVSGNEMERLPKSICKLLALQTLKTLDNTALKELPGDMKRLTNLRHLCFDVGGFLTTMPLELGNLTNLQSLSAFYVGTRTGAQINQLMNMDFLRGSLLIKNLDNVENATDARDAKLDQKSCLEKLNLVWEEIPSNPQTLDDITAHQALVIENLKPHENLKVLQINNYSGIRCPVWLSGSSRTFTRIHLEGLSYCTVLPCLGELPFLTSLYIGCMLRLTIIDDNFYGAGSSTTFRSLEFMELHDMKALVTWTDSKNNVSMPKLMSLLLNECPVLVTLPPNLQSSKTITRL